MPADSWTSPQLYPDRAADERFRAALDTMIDPFEVLEAVRGPDGEVVDFRCAFANRAALAWHGLPAEQWIGGHLRAALSDAAPGAFGMFRHVLETGEPLVVDGVWYEDSTPDGRRRRNAIDVRVARSGGSLVYTWRVVTDRLRAQEERAAATEHLERLNAELALHSAIVANATDGVALVREADGTIVYANPACEAMFGYGPGTMVGQPVAMMNAPEPGRSPEQVAAEIARDLASTGRWVGLVRHRRADGTAFWSRVSVSMFTHPLHGRVQVGTIADVSEAVESRQLIDRIFESSADLLGIVDADGTVRRLNPAWQRTLGWTDAELRAAPLRTFVHPEDADRWFADADADAPAGRDEDPGPGGPSAEDGVVAVENRFRCRDGSYRRLSWHGIRLPGTGTTVVNARDVTDRRASEALEERRARRDAILAQASAAFSRAGRDLDAIVDAAISELLVTFSDGIAVSLLSEDGTMLSTRVSLPTESEGRGRRFAAGHPIRLDERGPSQTVFHTGRPLVIPAVTPEAVRGHGDPRYTAFLIDNDIGGAMWRPIRAGDRTLGVLLLTRAGPAEPFTDDDLVLAGEVADRLALAIDNAQLFAGKDRVEAELRASEARFRSMFNSAPMGALMISRRPENLGGVLAVNDTLCALLDRPRERLLTMTTFDLVRPEDVERLHDRVMQLRPGDPPATIDLRAARADGTVIDLRVVLSMMGQGDEHDLAIALVEDVTTRRRLEQELTRRALFDDLTGLANRHLFLDRLGLALEQRRRSGGNVALIFVDIDHFKDINDSLGHHAGDCILSEVGRRVRANVRSIDTASRLAGDEFVIVCPDIHDATQALTIVERLHPAVTEPIEVDGEQLAIGVSLGLAVTGTAPDDIDGLLQAADAAMYQAKRRGRNRWEVYSDVLSRQAAHRHETEQWLRSGLEQDRFRLHYQPIVDLADGRIVGVEALLRLVHPTRGLLLPADFIDVAEDSELIVPIGDWVIDEACRQAARWNERFGPLEMAVNLSGRQFARPATLARVRRALAANNLDPAQLCLEMTERVLIEADEAIAADLVALTGEGVRLALDDFGTGYSSLVYLKRFPISTIKIDRSFVTDLGQRPDDTAIVRGIASIAHDLRLTTVAEGIEHLDQLDLLRSLRCDRAQGFLLEVPQDADAITRLLESRR